MRRLLGIVALLFVFAFAVLPAAAQDETLADLITARAAADSAEFTQLLAALEAADPSVLEALSDAGQSLTLFAPTDAAFDAVKAALGEEAFAALLADSAALTDLLLFHVTPGAVEYATLAGSVAALEAQPFAATSSLRVNLPTLQGQRVDVLPGFESLLIDRASLSPENADVQAANGVLHTIDTVLQPEATTIGDIIVSVAGGANGQFTQLLAALEAAGLLEALSDPDAEPVTVFMPTDAAFQAALEALGVTAEDLLADPETLTSLLQNHLVAGVVHAADLGGAATADPAPAWLAGFADDGSPLIQTVGGGTLAFQRGADGQPQIGGANIFVNDVDAGNGVIYVIDAVLQPSAAE